VFGEAEQNLKVVSPKLVSSQRADEMPQALCDVGLGPGTVGHKPPPGRREFMA